MTCRKDKDDVKTAGLLDCGTSSGVTCLRTERHPALRWPERTSGARTERENLHADARGKYARHGNAEHGDPVKAKVHLQRVRGGASRSSDEARESLVERRGCATAPDALRQPASLIEPMPSREEPRTTAKPFRISKRDVWKAYQHVKANHGAAGIDGQTIQEFDQDRKTHLYRLWNRLSSGSYFPPPVREVEIPKASGTGVRKLGIPTVADRVAQMVVKLVVEPMVEPHFHPDSYGYRPRKSALEAVGVARQRCWHYDWVVDLDIKGFFDNIDHALLLRAVHKHTNNRWVILYIERWLQAPVVQQDGTQRSRGRGSPQGSVISPLLSNLFLHYVFDEWMRRQYPQVTFERYADDVIIHCKTEREAQRIRTAVATRMAACGLEVHPEKTKVVYCKDGTRRGQYLHESFTFLGFGFRPRMAKRPWGPCTGFLPGIAKEKNTALRAVIRSWQLHRRSGAALGELAEEINPVIRGWIQYYGRYYRSALYPILRQVEAALQRWATRKYKKLRRKPGRATAWLGQIKRHNPTLFVHWRLAAYVTP